ncbi:hypothetical protein RSA31_21905 [Pantoea dispersa]|nr:hypothetical protein NS215_20895 [Pantoea dispersa]KTS84936.1 hypothetical protein RSA31_21905 [Pantoea dispersa]
MLESFWESTQMRLALTQLIQMLFLQNMAVLYIQQPNHNTPLKTQTTLSFTMGCYLDLNRNY